MSDDTPDPHVDTAEPSMEDILASIRRIIADEDGLAAEGEGGSSSDTSDIVEESFTIEVADTQSDAVEPSSLPTPESLEPDNDPLSDVDLLLAELDSDNNDTLELNVLATDEPSETSSSLKGLGAVAAASLGAIASAGAATADSITEARKNPKPEPMPLNTADNLEDDALDLLLDQDDILTEFDAEDGIDSLLQIPESDTPEAVDDVDLLLAQLLSDDEPSGDDILSPDEVVIDPAADMIEDYKAQSSDLVSEDVSAIADDSNEISDEILSELLGNEIDDAFDADDIEIVSPTDVDISEVVSSHQQTNDLDLVKSLMADLTADPYEADAESGASMAYEESDVVDEILSLSMDDETDLLDDSAVEKQASETNLDEDVAAVDPFVIDVNEDLSIAAQPEEKSAALSLAEVAQAAKSDAESVKLRSGSGAVGLAAGAGLLISSISDNDEGESLQGIAVDEDVSRDLQEAQDILTEINKLSEDDASVEGDAPKDSGEDQIADLEEIAAEITPQDTKLTQETAEMPKAAAKQDTIIDQVTEEATAGAFASLNQVVENNAVVQERGDRIGDLVQEALRPMLKEWLDKNLKGIVERAVTKEVKRISSGK